MEPVKPNPFVFIFQVGFGFLIAYVGFVLGAYGLSLLLWLLHRSN